MSYNHLTFGAGFMSGLYAGKRGSHVQEVFNIFIKMADSGGQTPPVDDPLSVDSAVGNPEYADY
jgi:hypothetical protein